MNISIEESWGQILKAEFEKPYFKSLVDYLKKEKASGKIIYPKGSAIFKAFELTPFRQVKAVLLGQDPYHGPEQAHGLCFSVQKGVRLPPSLANMYKELETDLGITPANHGNLEQWAKQGVLMLNTSLTVLQGQPMSHSKIGWEQFTNAVIQMVSEYRSNIVFILWGRFAQQKEALINADKHFIIKSAHPSPLSAWNGFLGSKPYSTCNQYLSKHQIGAIDWKVD